MPVMNGGWEIVDLYDQLRVGDIVKYSTEIKEYFKQNGIKVRRGHYRITLLFRNSTEKHLIMERLDGQQAMSFIVTDDMYIKVASNIKVLERKKNAGN